jgi:signal transduction histidine kinase
LAVKEILHNVVKHAGATEVKLIFSSSSPLIITIKDNGIGISSALLKRFAERDQTLIGNGLYNIRQRMESLDGSLIIENDQGTCLKLKTGIVWP